MADPKSSSVQNIQIRLKSSSDNSQRAVVQREPSRTIAIKRAGIRKPVCQPQKSKEAPRRKRGDFIKLQNPNHIIRNPMERPFWILSFQCWAICSFNLTVL